MWISKKKWSQLNKEIAGLEVRVQSQQKEIKILKSQCKARLVSPSSQVAQNVLKGSDSVTFRANLNNRKLFEQIIEQKH